MIVTAREIKPYFCEDSVQYDPFDDDDEEYEHWNNNDWIEDDEWDDEDDFPW